MKPIIQIQGLRKTYNRTVAVDDLALAVPESQVTAFLGPNGAGKTTTIKCILNLLQPDAGEVTVLGCNSRRLGVSEFQRIAYVSENQELPLWMTVRQLLDYCRPLYPTWDLEFEKKLLKDFELPPHTKLKALSRGMRMKAALLSNLVYRPRLVILDEPFSGLDPLVRDEFIRGLLELTEEEGWSVFVSSHDIAEVERLADRVAILHAGRLHLDETASDLQARFRTIEVVLPEERPQPGALPPSWLNVEMAGRTVRFTDTRYEGTRLDRMIAEYWPGAHPHKATPMTLREIFVALARTFRLNGVAATHGKPVEHT